MSSSSLDALHRIASPSGIAIIGASESPGKAGERRLRSLIQSGYQGRIFPVNPARKSIQGLPAYSSILEIEEPCDLAMIVVGPDRVPECLQQCVDKNIAGIIVVTAGAGGEADPYSIELASIIANSSSRLVGPNCSGIFSAKGGVNLLGLPNIPSGSVGVLSQSGNIIDSLLHYARDCPFGFSRIFGVGNTLDLKILDYLRYLGEDQSTEVILAYIEGLSQAERLVEVAHEILPKKPIIAIKVGDTEAGARAVQSHTASLATDARVTDAILRQAGIIRVQDANELWETAVAYLRLPPLRGKRIALMSEGGGHNAVAADNVSRCGFLIPELTPQLQSAIRPHLLENMAAGNPIDYGGTAEENPRVIANCVEPCLRSDEVDAVVITGFFGGYAEFIAEHIAEKEVAAARALRSLAESYDTPLLVHSSFVGSGVESLDLFRNSRIASYRSIKTLARVLANVASYYTTLESVLAEQAHAHVREDLPAPGHSSILSEVRSSGYENLTETEAREFLAPYRLPFLDAQLCTSEAELRDARENFGFPLALKIVSRDILHKSDIGGVLLNVATDEDLHLSFKRILQRAKSHDPDCDIDGVLVSPMASPGHECIAGFSRDATFGPIVMYGTGGTQVELFKDVALRGLPLGESDVRKMLDEVRGTTLMRGFRGRAPADVESLIVILKTLAAIASTHPGIAGLDLNPIIVNEHGAQIVDARITLVRNV